MRTLIISIGALALLSACGHKDEKKYTYDYTINNCDTGQHNAESKEQYCSILKDDGANKGCALEERKKAFNDASCGDWNG